MSTNPTSSELVERLNEHIASLEYHGADNTPRLSYDDICEIRDILESTRVINTVLTATPGEAGLREEVERLKEVLRLHDAYLAVPADRGGQNGPKGKAYQAFEDAKRAALNGGGDCD